MFESGSGRPLIFQIESNTVLSSLVTATLKLDASETLDDQLVNQSYLDQSVGRIKKRKSSHVEPEVNQPTKKQNRNRKKPSPRLPSPVRISPVRNAIYLIKQPRKETFEQNNNLFIKGAISSGK